MHQNLSKKTLLFFFLKICGLYIFYILFCVKIDPGLLLFFQNLYYRVFVFSHLVKQLEILKSAAKLDLKLTPTYLSNLCFGFWCFRSR